MPLYFQTTAGEGNKIAVWHITESYGELCKMVDVSREEKDKVESFRLESRKKEWMAVRVLVKRLLGEYHKIFYTPTGAPYFKSLNKRLGITHTNGYAGIATGNEPVALDMEKASPRIGRVYTRFVNENEMSFIKKEDNRIGYFNLIWTAKETLFKLYDRQDVIFKDNLNIRPFNLSGEGHITADVIFEDLKEMVEMHYRIFPDFTLTWYEKRIK
ncbi:MAG: 4'-phosphopantetheinyl transferase superfamily protein [Chlorobi bacterium]|nr:4'-phosphopantetheinyl transferase superfamily protein [Chlorobiota bacterium]